MAGVGRTFFERTQYRFLGPSDQQQGRAQPPLERLLPTTVEAPLLELPPADGLPADLASLPLREAIQRRQSVRDYSDEPLSLEDLSLLLWGTQGVRRTIPGKATFRAVPSAGARHPFETLLLIRHAASLDPGLYQYLAGSHRLRPLSHDTALDVGLTKACLDQACVARCAALFVWIADVRRMTWRYGERGFRYLLVDAGHVCQNLYLLAEALGLGACAIGAFQDEEVSALLAIDPAELLPVYLATVGRPA